MSKRTIRLVLQNDIILLRAIKDLAQEFISGSQTALGFRLRPQPVYNNAYF